MPITKTSYIDDLVQQGYTEKVGSKKQVAFRGRIYNESIYHNKITQDEAGKTSEVSGTVLGGMDPIATSVKPNCVKTKTAPPLEEKTVYTPVADSETNRGLGFDPTDRKSIQSYLEKPEVKQNIHEAYGHHYVLVKGRKGISSCIFIPHTEDHHLDYGKAQYIKLWKASGGTPLKESRDIWRAVRSIAATYEELEGKIDEKVTEIAGKLAKKKGIDENDKVKMEKLKELVRKGIQSMAYDFKKHQVRLYGALDPNEANTDTYMTGAIISLSEDAKRELDTIYNKDLMEHKDTLSGNRPFKDEEDKGVNGLKNLMQSFQPPKDKGSQPQYSDSDDELNDGINVVDPNPRVEDVTDAKKSTAKKST